MNNHAALVTTLLCLIGASGPIHAEFIPLGDLPGGLFLSRAQDVSSDGSVVVGHSVSASGFGSFRWTATTGMVGLDLPGSIGGSATATSANGSVVVGISLIDQAYRWSAATGMIEIGVLPGFAQSRAFGVSANGSVVVGNSNSTGGQGGEFHAFRWTASTGMVDLGSLSGGGVTSALGVSADGTVVVGLSGFPGREAFRWTHESGMVGLGDLPGGNFHSVAFNASADGSVVVGESQSASSGIDTEVFRWTETTGMVGLGFLGTAFDVSADGSVIVGRRHIPLEVGRTDSGAFVWDETHGMRDLRDVLIAQGDDLTGWTLMEATGISSDGRTIVGRGKNPAGDEEAWLARLAPVFAGTRGTPNCHGESISALVHEFGGLKAAASASGFPSVQALHDAIRAFCRG